MPRLAILAICSLAVALVRAEPLQPMPLWTFNGSEWSGLRLGAQTDADLKKAFGAGKGAVRPEALRLTSADQNVRVDALLDGRGGKAVMRAIRVEWDNGPSVAEVAAQLKTEPVELYDPTRHEDWGVIQFPGKGVLAVVLNRRIDFWLLAAPAVADKIASSFTSQPSEVRPVPDPGEGWDRTVIYGLVQATVRVPSNDNIPSALNSSGRDDLQSYAVREGRNLRGRPLEFQRGESGRLTIEISYGRFNEKGETSVTISAALNSGSPYGVFTSSASQSRKIDSSYIRRTLDLLDSVLEALMDTASDRIRALRPPPPETRRLAITARMLDEATGIRRT